MSHPAENYSSPTTAARGREGSLKKAIVAVVSLASLTQYQWNSLSGTMLREPGPSSSNTNDQWLPYHDNLGALAVYGTVQ